MINLYTYLKTKFDDVEDILQISTDNVWAALNPKNKNGKYSAYSVIERAKKFRIEVYSQEHESKYKKSHFRHKKLLDYLCTDGVLNEIVTCKPENFDRISKSIYHYLTIDDLYRKCGNSYYKQDFGELLYKRVFNYDNYRKNPVVGEIYQKLGFDKAACPYCNSAPVTIIKSKKDRTKEGSGFVLFDLDHFYPKSKYPYLALSFYNHIPSCSVCNGNLKRSRDFTIGTHIHPYNRCFDDIYTFKPNVDISEGKKLKTLSLHNNANQKDDLVEDLSLNERYMKLLHVCNLEGLIEMMQDDCDLFEPAKPEDDVRYRALFIKSIKSHVKVNKGEILTSTFCKLKRDLIKFFDGDNIIIKD